MGSDLFSRRKKWLAAFAIGVVCLIWPETGTVGWNRVPWSGVLAHMGRYPIGTIPFERKKVFLESPMIWNAPMGPYAPPKGETPDSNERSGLESQLYKGHSNILTFLLVGVDSRKGEPARADTIIVAFVNSSRHKVAIVSIPRDTRTPVAGHGVTKVNHAMMYGGDTLLRATVEKLLDWPIDYVVNANFNAFKSVVDQIGGLDVDVERNMSYDDPTDGTSIHLNKGLQHLSGQQVLDYARFRHDIEADTGRMRRQKEVFKAMVAQSTSFRMWPKYPSMIAKMSSEVHTDAPLGTLLSLASRFLWISDQDVTVFQFNGTNAVNADDDLWYFYVDKGEPWQLQRSIKSWESGK